MAANGFVKGYCLYLELICPTNGIRFLIRAGLKVKEDPCYYFSTMRRSFVIVLSFVLILIPVLVQAQDQEVSPISIPEIELTPEMVKVGIDGRITVLLEIDELGNVGSVRLEGGPMWPCGSNPKKELAAFRSLAERTLKTARFRPKAVQGKAVSTKISLTLLIGNVLKARKRQFAVKNGERVDPAVHGPDVIYQIADAPLGPTALSLPKPAYPPAARARNLQGRAIVDVVIDEDGKVRLAGYISGELLLLSSSRDSACKAKFNRQIIDGKAVKVIGVVEYTFIAPR